MSLPVAERPRERCLRHGPESLSIRECLALLIQSGVPGRNCLQVAESICERSGKGLSDDEQTQALFIALEGAGLAHLTQVEGLGSAAQARILAAFELGRRYAIRRMTDSSPAERADPEPNQLPDLALAQIPAAYRSESREWLGFVPWLRTGKMGKFCCVERGARTHVNVDPAELFARVLALRPRAFFLFHNHPSGDLHPSKADEHLTDQVREVGHRISTPLLGHCIVTSRSAVWV